MNHLSDEQFEDVLQDNTRHGGHLERCAQCRMILAQKQALAARLRTAFAPVQADAKLVRRVSAQIKGAGVFAGAGETGGRGRVRRLVRRFWPPVAAAAALLVIVVPLSLYFSSTSEVRAAQEELVEIHNDGIRPQGDFFTDADPENLAHYFKSKLGFAPAFPRLGQGMSLRGCCVKYFREKMTGSYVVDSPEGIISIIMVTDSPQSLGLTQRAGVSGSRPTFWDGHFAHNNLVAVRLGNYTYCAVGEVSSGLLGDLLSRLLP